MSSTPRVTTVRVEVPVDEELTITPLSDLHIEGAAFDKEGFDALMRERAKLPNHRAIIIGDAMDLVVPPDLRRWRASVQDSSLRGRDDWLNAGVDLAVERLTAHGIAYDMVAPGNHEDEFVKRHGVDVTSMLARELRCSRGGYSGYVEYHISTKMQNGSVARRVPTFRILYHHGAWGGRVMKGFGGARDFARAFDGWHCFCYGHNHQSTAHRETKFRPARMGKLVEMPVYYVCTGSWVESYSEDAKLTHYAERHGYMPTTRTTPLIRVRAVNHGGPACRGKNAQKGWALDYTVEL